LFSKKLSRETAVVQFRRLIKEYNETPALDAKEALMTQINTIIPAVIREQSPLPYIMQAGLAKVDYKKRQREYFLSMVQNPGQDIYFSSKELVLAKDPLIHVVQWSDANAKHFVNYIDSFEHLCGRNEKNLISKLKGKIDVYAKMIRSDHVDSKEMDTLLKDINQILKSLSLKAASMQSTGIKLDKLQTYLTEAILFIENAKPSPKPKLQ